MGYGFKNNNWSFTANASLAGAYIYGGYDTKAGWMAGVGFGFGTGITGLSTNLTSVGLNWSQNGGVSGNAFGITASSNGINFDPSIGASLNISIKIENSTNSLGICKMSESIFKSEEEMKKYLSEKGFAEGKFHIDKYYYKDMQINPDGTITGGTTKAVYINGKLLSQSITMRPNSSYEGFNRTFNHELIHTYDNFKYGQYLHGSEQLKKAYTETKAYAYTDQSSLKSTMPYSYGKYIGPISLFDLPSYLIPTPMHYLNTPVVGL